MREAVAGFLSPATVPSKNPRKPNPPECAFHLTRESLKNLFYSVSKPFPVIPSMGKLIGHTREKE